MKKLTFLVLILAAGGCKVTKLALPMPDGRVATASDTRFLTTTKAQIELVINPTTGEVTLKVKVASKGDAAMAESVAEGTARGVAQGLK